MNLKMWSPIYVLVSYCISLCIAAPIVDQDTSEDQRDENRKITQKWLIESINRLQKDMNEISSSYTAHLDATKTDSFKKERVFVHDVQILRADHTVLANQQQQIIQLIKERGLAGLKSSQHPQDDSSNQKTEDDKNTSSDSISKEAQDHHQHRKPHHRSRSSTEHIEHEKKFEANTKRNVTELFAELSALHDITIALFHDLQDLEVRVGKKQQQPRQEEGESD